MRIGNWVETLARTYRVTLLIVSADPAVTEAALDSRWRTLCEACHVVNVSSHVAPGGLTWAQRLSPSPRLWSTWPIEATAKALRDFQARRFDAALVFRLRLVPVWRVLRDRLGVRVGRCVLDFDDVESRLQSRQVREGGPRHYGRLGYVLGRLEAVKLAWAQCRAGREFDVVTVCSDDDRAFLLPRLGASFLLVVPNCVRLPERLSPMPAPGPVRLLFVGALAYQPNATGLSWFLEQVLTALRRAGEPAVRLIVVGRQPPKWMKERAAAGDFELHADVPAVAPFYAASDIVVVPLLTGGGTRIKIIEAFGFGRPVVSTRIGAEGIDAAHEQELLLADDAAAFAAEIQRLAASPVLRQQLADAAHERVQARYSLDTFAQAVRRCFPPTTA